MKLRTCFSTLFTVITLNVIAAATGQAQDVNSDVDRAMQTRVTALATPSGRRIGTAHIAAANFLQKFYEAREYRLIWNSPDSIKALRQVIADSWTDGLQAVDFHAQTLGIGASDGTSAQLTAIERDIVLTDAYVRLLYQLYFGKVDPERVDPSWNYKRRLPNGEAVEIINNAIENGGIARLAAFASPQRPRYRQMRAILKKMVARAQEGGWPILPDGPVMKPGEPDPRIPILRKRLSAIELYVPQPDESTEAYDDNLVAAVKAFQTLQGLDADGIIGPNTLAALNVSVQQRIDQIRVNLERARWILPAFEGQDDLIVVNAAGFYLWLFLDGKYVWRTDVITGKPYHKTPVFTEQMTYIVLNPDWSVPRSIIRNEIFPKAKADPSYIAAKNYELITSGGKKVAATSLDWSTLNPAKFPYRVVQKPGPRNALGLVKFIFPNRFNVYLHDTPSRQLFSKTGRAFSHGCIRVKDPMKLAELILGQRNNLSRNEIDAVVASSKLRRINLKKPLRVAVLYWTVDPGLNGEIFFHKDIYGRDAKLLKALNAEFKLK